MAATPRTRPGGGGSPAILATPGAPSAAVKDVYPDTPAPVGVNSAPPRLPPRPQRVAAVAPVDNDDTDAASVTVSATTRRRHYPRAGTPLGSGAAADAASQASHRSRASQARSVVSRIGSTLLHALPRPLQTWLYGGGAAHTPPRLANEQTRSSDGSSGSASLSLSDLSDDAVSRWGGAAPLSLASGSGEAPPRKVELTEDALAHVEAAMGPPPSRRVLEPLSSGPDDLRWQELHPGSPVRDGRYELLAAIPVDGAVAQMQVSLMAAMKDADIAHSALARLAQWRLELQRLGIVEAASAGNPATTGTATRTVAAARVRRRPWSLVEDADGSSDDSDSDGSGNDNSADCTFAAVASLTAEVAAAHAKLTHAFDTATAAAEALLLTRFGSVTSVGGIDAGLERVRAAASKVDAASASLRLCTCMAAAMSSCYVSAGLMPDPIELEADGEMATTVAFALLQPHVEPPFADGEDPVDLTAGVDKIIERAQANAMEIVGGRCLASSVDSCGDTAAGAGSGRSRHGITLVDCETPRRDANLTAVVAALAADLATAITSSVSEHSSDDHSRHPAGMATSTGMSVVGAARSKPVPGASAASAMLPSTTHTSGGGIGKRRRVDTPEDDVASDTPLPPSSDHGSACVTASGSVAGKVVESTGRLEYSVDVHFRNPTSQVVEIVRVDSVCWRHGDADAGDSATSPHISDLVVDVTLPARAVVVQSVAREVRVVLPPATSNRPTTMLFGFKVGVDVDASEDSAAGNRNVPDLHVEANIVCRIVPAGRGAGATGGGDDSSGIVWGSWCIPVSMSRRSVA